MSQVINQSEERARLHRQLTEQAIQLALQSRWEEAVAVNRQILASVPRDASALNRLGKALSETGNYAEAKRAYSAAPSESPSVVGRGSFPPQVGAGTVRPYIKDTMLRYDRDEEEDELTDEEGEYTEADDSTEERAETEFEESDTREMEE